MSVNHTARIEQLDQIEKDVAAILKNASLVLTEISRDRPSQKAVEQYNLSVVNNIRSVDTKLSEQIKYLTQVSTGNLNARPKVLNKIFNYEII